MMKQFLILVITLSSTMASAKTSLWKVSKNNSSFYLGGTCHILRPEDYPLPKQFSAAYNDSDQIIFEADISKLEDPKVMESMTNQMMYPTNAVCKYFPSFCPTLEQDLNATTIVLLKNYCKKNGVSFDNIKKMRPGFVSTVLTMVELTKLGVTSGVDEHFFKRAMQDSKKMKFLETVDEQLNLLFNMGKGNEDALITKSILEAEDINANYEKMVNKWKEGDDMSSVFSEMQSQFPKLHKELITDRDQKWVLPILESFHEISDGQTTMVLVGAGHIDGLLKSFIKLDYKIEQL